MSDYTDESGQFPAIDRVDGGRFAPGVSGNPGGVSREQRRLIIRVRELAAERSEAALTTLIGIMEDSKAPHAARIAAACAVLDRGLGKPANHLTVESEERVSPTMPPLELARRLAFVLREGVRAMGRPLELGTLQALTQDASEEPSNEQ